LVSPGASPCSLSAVIECGLVSNSARSCSDLAPPTVTKCSGSSAQQLRFIYNAKPCTAANSTGSGFTCTDSGAGPTSSDVFIAITNDNETDSYFVGVVEPGVIFGTSSDAILADRIKVKVSSLNGSAPDQLLQTVSMNISCAGEGSDVSLLSQYGSLQLTAFENAASGFQTAVEVISQNFIVTNVGAEATTLSWANITSTLYGTTALVSPPGIELASNESLSFPYATTPINLYASNGQTFSSSFSVAQSGDLACSSSAELSITVGV
jgi:hypothetical protein